MWHHFAAQVSRLFAALHSPEVAKTNPVRKLSDILGRIRCKDVENGHGEGAPGSFCV